MTNTIAKRIGRYVALPVAAAGIVGGAALGLAGAAGAATTPDATPQVRTGIVATPHVKAKPAPNVVPGPWWSTNNPGVFLQAGSTHFLAPNL